MAALLPPGYHFFPSDVELLSYLPYKIKGASFPTTWPVVPPIKEEVLYGREAHEPQKIFSLYGKEEEDSDDPVAGDLYFFTLLSKKFVENGEGKGKGKEKEKATKMSRVAGAGSWKIQRTRPVTDRSGRLVGSKSQLNFKKDGCLNSWIMHEYVHADSAGQDYQWAVCRIRRGLSKNKDPSVPLLPENGLPPLESTDCCDDVAALPALESIDCCNDVPAGNHYASSSSSSCVACPQTETSKTAPMMHRNQCACGEQLRCFFFLFAMPNTLTLQEAC